jgi:hypothetical protein
VTKLHQAVLVALGVYASAAFVAVVGMAWGFWRAYRPPTEVRIHYVQRVKPAPSAAPTLPNADLSAR